MDCKVVITKLAEIDLGEIVNYISNELSSPQAASAFLDKVEKCFDNLKISPLMYEECQNDRLRTKRYRKVVINNYIMFYRYDDTDNTVYILRFIYGRRDYIDLI